MVAAIGEVMVRSSIDRDDYIVNGTSMAAPVVAGTLALGKQRFGRSNDGTDPPSVGRYRVELDSGTTELVTEDRSPRQPAFV